jgi:hypothetical protein
MHPVAQKTSAHHLRSQLVEALSPERVLLSEDSLADVLRRWKLTPFGNKPARDSFRYFGVRIAAGF